VKEEFEGTNAIAAPVKAKSPVGSAGPTVVVPERRLVQAWRRQGLVVLTLVFSDALFAFLFWGLALNLHAIWRQGQPLEEVTSTYILSSTVLWIGLRALVGLYPGYGLAPAEELRRQSYATLATLAITTLFAFAFQAGALLPRLLIGINFLELLLLAPLVRHFVKQGMAKVELWGKPVVVLGAGKTAKQLVINLRREWGLGFRPVAVFDFRLAPVEGALEGVPYEGSLSDAMEVAQKQNIDTVIFAMPQIQRKHLAKLVDAAGRRFRNVIVMPNLGGITNSAIVARDFAGLCGVEIKHNLLNTWSRMAKRVLDLFGAVVGGLLIAPLLLAMGVLIKLDSAGPLFYAHMRLGTDGQYFYCWKFRTMHTDASQLLTELLQSNPDLRSEWEANHKLRDDPRITRVGRLLRKTSLDELPQLWNVLRGEMSLAGPRPIVDAEAPKYGEAYELYQRVKPGMTGLWQVSGRSGTSYEERVAIDTYYVRDWSIWLDLVILARTVKIVICRRGAC